MKVFREAYLDPEEKFYDYRTGTVEGSDIFDTTTTGTSYGNNFLTKSGLEYMQNSKNKNGEIKYLSPTEYFQECADIFGSTLEKQISQTSIDKKTLDHLNQVITKYKRKFPITYLDYADMSQEGRHRMYVAGEMFGWKTKFPVLIITWHDQELHDKQEKEEKEFNIKIKIKRAIEDVLHYEYRNIDELLSQLPYSINKAFYVSFDEPDQEFTTKDHNDKIEIIVDGVSEFLDKKDIKYKESDEDDLDIDEYDDIDEEDFKKWLKDNNLDF